MYIYLIFPTKKTMLCVAISFTILTGCNAQQNDKGKELEENSAENVTSDSTLILSRNIRKAYPGFQLRLDPSTFDIGKYPNVIYPDTTKCESFRVNRNLLGKLSNVKAIVQAHASMKRVLFLQSGNLKLWVCNFPEKSKAGDSLIITGFVYDILGNEKTWGYPTILTEVHISH